MATARRGAAAPELLQASDLLPKSARPRARKRPHTLADCGKQINFGAGPLSGPALVAIWGKACKLQGGVWDLCRSGTNRPLLDPAWAQQAVADMLGQGGEFASNIQQPSPVRSCRRLHCNLRQHLTRLTKMICAHRLGGGAQTEISSRRPPASLRHRSPREPGPELLNDFGASDDNIPRHVKTLPFKMSQRTYPEQTPEPPRRPEPTSATAPALSPMAVCADFCARLAGSLRCSLPSGPPRFGPKFHDYTESTMFGGPALFDTPGQMCRAICRYESYNKIIYSYQKFHIQVCWAPKHYDSRRRRRPRMSPSTPRSELRRCAAPPVTSS